MNLGQADDRPRFNYNSYMQTLHQKLAEHQTNAAAPPREFVGTPIGLAVGNSILDGSELKDDPFKKDRFKNKILEKLGGVGDFDDPAEPGDLNGNFADGLDIPSDMDYEEQQ